MKLTKKHARKVLELVDAGLTSGLGKPEPGQMCIMAAINYALGLPHGDNPATCVGSAVRAFDITINDASWSSNDARAKGMRREAIAKLGSNTLDQVEFSKKLTLKVIQRILPQTLRIAGLESHAVACEQAKTLEEGGIAARAAADAAAYAAARAARAAAARAADAAADAAAYAARAAAAYAARDEILTLTCELAVEVLIEMKSPGVKWLDLCNTEEKV